MKQQRSLCCLRDELFGRYDVLINDLADLLHERHSVLPHKVVFFVLLLSLVFAPLKLFFALLVDISSSFLTLSWPFLL